MTSPDRVWSVPYVVGIDDHGCVWSDGKRRTPEEVQAMLAALVVRPQEDECCRCGECDG